MKRVDFCRLALQSGMVADHRSRAAFSRELLESKAIYGDLKPEMRAVSELDTFSNPYTDSRIFHRSPEQNVNMVFAGIDTETPELLLADRRNEKGTVMDAICANLPRIVGSRSLLLFSAACPG